MISIKPEILKALLVTVSKDASRRQLRGVHFHRRADDVLYASTDGNRLTLARVPIDPSIEVPENEPTEGILPVGFCEQALKVHNKLYPLICFSFSLYSSPDPTSHGRIVATHDASGLHEQLIDDRYPDYMRVVPRTFSGVTAQFSADYMADLAKIQKIIGDTYSPYILHNGYGTALAVFQNGDIVQALWPLKFKLSATVPDWLQDGAEPVTAAAPGPDAAEPVTAA